MKRGLSKVICAMLAVASFNTCMANSAKGATYNIDVENAVATYFENESPVSGIIDDEYAIQTVSFDEDTKQTFAYDNKVVGEDDVTQGTSSGIEIIESTTDQSHTSRENVKVSSRLWELFFGKNEPKTLIASGDVFGIKLKQKYASVVEAPGVPALKVGDCITAINGKEVHSAEEIKTAISKSQGESITVTAVRGGEIFKLEVIPKLEGGEYRIGITLKDLTAGIGTITFIDPESGEFGGLGHGICSAENGQVIEMERGGAMEVALGGIHKGEVGNPGELSGVMSDSVIGEIYLNCEVGVFGKMNFVSEKTRSNLYQVGTKDDVKEGEATIISTVKNGKKAEYKIEIYDIDRSSNGSKSFKIKVKDPALLAITGGIVRGMSGSPIIQNGKLIGAVTHVLVNDPTVGYGIFIENMLNASASEQKKAA